MNLNTSFALTTSQKSIDGIFCFNKNVRIVYTYTLDNCINSFLHIVQVYSSICFNTVESLYEKIQLYFTKWFLLCLLWRDETGLLERQLTLQEFPS